MTRFIPFSRDRGFLRPPDVKDWLPSYDVAHLVVAAVDRVPLGAFAVRPVPVGKARYHPHLLLALLISCYANGIVSSRRIERATHHDLGVRDAAAHLHPDHIAAFRRANRAEAANAEGQPHPQVLRAEIAWRDALKARLDAACARPEDQARAEAEAALEGQKIELLLAIGRTQPHRAYDFRPPPDPKLPRRITEPWRLAMRAKMETEDAKRLCERRQKAAEPVFGTIKTALGFTRFHLRGLANAAAWTLIALAHNLHRLHQAA
ncbi:transposase [Elioraea sp.]|uniref:transposase n=1 Tax=Elioraea sp. TaxID=2185103 RepID=UPI00307E84F1